MPHAAVPPSRTRDCSLEMVPTLRDIFLNHDGKVSDKWEQYIYVYESEFKGLLAAKIPVRLLEIGVQNGGSLEVWRKYLPEGSTILGLDVDERVAALEFQDDRVGAKVCNATDRESVRRILGDAIFDVIIDDGSHLCHDVIETFSLLFPHLAPGGKYIIEDLHCSYYRTHGGGFKAADSSIEWLKTLIDSQNFDHISPNESVDSTDIAQLSSYNQWLARIAFYDSVVVVDKLPSRKERPYRRIISGSEDLTYPLKTNFLHGAVPDPDSVWLGPVVARQIDQDAWASIGRLRETETILRDDLLRSRASLEEVCEERNQLKDELERREIALAQLETLSVERDSLMAEFRQMTSKFDEATAKANDLAANVERTKSENQRELATLGEERNFLASELQRVSSTSDKATAKARDLEEELEKTQRKTEMALTAMSGERDLLIAKTDDLVRRLTDMSQAYFAATENSDKLCAQIEASSFAQAQLHEEARARYRAVQVRLLRTEADLSRAKRKERESRPRHDLSFRRRERREERMLLQTGLFDANWYANVYPEVVRTGKSPSQHFLDEGYLNGLRPNPAFDPAWYLEQYEDVRNSGLNPLIHYALHGYREGRDPSADFKTEAYLNENPDVRTSGVNPLLHYLREKKSEAAAGSQAD